MDPDDELQRVVRPARTGFWIGIWAVGLGAVVLVALLGSLGDAGSPPSPPPVAIATASPSPSPTVRPTPTPTAAPGIDSFRGGTPPAPRPFPSRPPLGEDGLVGGLVFGTNWPPE